MRDVRDVMMDLLTRYRAYVLVFVGLPVGYLFDLVLRVRAFVVQRLFAAPELHDRRVRRVQDDVRRWGWWAARRPW